MTTPETPAEVLADIARRIVDNAIPATESGATCFVPRYQIDQLSRALEAERSLAAGKVADPVAEVMKYAQQALYWREKYEMLERDAKNRGLEPAPPADPVKNGNPLTRDNEESLMLALAEFITASAYPEDPRLEVAYAIARHLKLGWPAADPAKASGSAPDGWRELRQRRQAEMADLMRGGEFAQGKAAGIRSMLAELDAITATPPASAPEVTTVLPLESATVAGLTCDDLLSDWVPGGIKPAEHGTYLRQFPAGEFDEDPEETEALSSWDGIGQWKMGDASDFFSNASPEQSAPWRGVCPRKLIAALTAALQEGKSHG